MDETTCITLILLHNFRIYIDVHIVYCDRFTQSPNHCLHIALEVSLDVLRVSSLPREVGINLGNLARCQAVYRQLIQQTPYR